MSKPRSRSNSASSKSSMTGLEMMQPNNLNLKDLPTPLYHGQGSQILMLITTLNLLRGHLSFKQQQMLLRLWLMYRLSHLRHMTNGSLKTIVMLQNLFLKTKITITKIMPSFKPYCVLVDTIKAFYDIKFAYLQVIRTISAVLYKSQQKP